MATSLCPPTVMDETLNLNSSAYVVLVSASLFIADTEVSFSTKQSPLRGIAKVSMSFSNVRASNKFPINTNMTVHYNPRILSEFLYRIWHSNGRTDRFILNRSLLWVTKILSEM